MIPLYVVKSIAFHAVWNYTTNFEKIDQTKFVYELKLKKLKNRIHVAYYYFLNDKVISRERERKEQKILWRTKSKNLCKVDLFRKRENVQWSTNYFKPQGMKGFRIQSTEYKNFNMNSIQIWTSDLNLLGKYSSAMLYSMIAILNDHVLSWKKIMVVMPKLKNNVLIFQFYWVDHW